MEALSAMALPPGFGFHPTDVELISHYLKRKVLGLKTDLEVIPEVDIYKHEPWDLPARCQVPTRDCKWHFFSSRDRKYPKGSRSNRATKAGFWKSTGKDRNIRFQNRAIGTKKTLVFHKGRPPGGRRTDWIMHEYYINESECKAAPDMKDSFVLCRITKRDGLVVAGANVGDNVLQPENIDGFSNQTQDVDSLVTAKKSPSPSDSVEDMDAWISELFDPSADSILTEIKSEPTEGISSVAINQEPLNPNFLPETADDLFQVDEFYNILQSDQQQTFDDQQGGTFRYPINDPQEQDVIFTYLNYNNNEFITPTEDTTIITDTGITLRQRGATPSSSSVQRQRIKLQVSKMESRNTGPSLCRTVEFEQGFHLDHHDEKPKSVSDDALRVGKTKMSSSLVAQDFRAEKRNAAKSRFSCFFVGACIVGAGAVALIYYFSALRS